METLSVALTRRGQFLNHASSIAFRHLFGSAVAALAAATLTINPQPAAAADVVCAPDPSGTLIGNATETCAGPGDRVNYGVAPATASSTVTLNGVTISNATTDGVSVNAGDTSQTLLTSGGGSILSTGGSGINFFTTTTGTGTLSVGTATNRISVPVTGGNGAAAAQGIFVTGRGDVNVFTGAVPIVSTSTGGGSWAIRAQSVFSGSGPGGAVVVDTQGALTGQRGGILATTTGTDVTDTVSVITVGTVTGNAGSGIEARGINGDVSVSASGAVIGSVGVGTGGGIVVQTTGTGNGFVNTLSGGTVSATGAGANGITATASGAGGVTLNIGANVTSAASTGILTTATTGNANITIGGAAAVAGTVGISAASTGTGNITILSGNGATGKVTGNAGDGIFASSTSTGTVSVGSAASRFNIISTGGNGAAAANGIRVESNGSVNVFTGIAAISSTSTAGASWGIRARSLSGGSGPGGAVVVDSQGAVSGPGGIQATTNGTDTTDTVTVVATGPVTGNAGAGIQARSVNGNASVTASGAIAGSVGTAANGIDVAASGTGNVAITTLAGGTVTATGTAMGIVSSAATGDQTLNIGANVTSAASTGIQTTATTGITNITIGGAAAVAGTVGISAGSTGTGNITILSGNGATGKVTGTAGDGIFASSTSTGTVSVGSAASRFNIISTGGNGAAAANGIRVESNGSVNVFTGTAAISSTSTAGASWGIRARSLSGGSGPGGAVVVDSQGAVSGPGGIQATTNGTDVTDTVTVVATGPVTGNAGAGIQARSVNGNASVTASGAVAGSVGTAANGIDVAASGTGNVAITTLAGGTVTATGTAIGIVSSAGAGGQSLSIGANVTSANSNAIKVTNTGATGLNVISLGSAVISAPGTNSTGAIIDITSASGGLTTLNTAAGTSIFSRSATTAAQNGDLAIHGAGGSVIINHGGSLRGRVDFSGMTAAADNVTFNNNSLTSWHTTGTSTFSAGNDVFNNNGLLAANGTTVLDFAGGRDVFNNNAGASFTIGEIPGVSITRLNNLEVFNNAGTIQLSNGETNDALVATSAAYVSSGAATISLDAALGSTVQSACTAQVADCVSLGVASGTGTRIVVNDTNATGAGVLNPAGMVLVEVAPGSTEKFTLSGSNVQMTPQGPAIVKGFVQYQLALDPTHNTVALVGAPNGSMLETGNLIAGAENIWHVTAESWEERLAAARHSYAAPGTAQGGDSGFSVWAKVYDDQFRRDRSQTVSVIGVAQNYDTSYRQITSGVQVGADTVMRNSDGSAIITGALLGYGQSHMHFNADENRANYTLWNIGVYGSYLDGPLFIDLLAKYDSLSTNFDFHGLPSLQSMRGNSVGAKLVVGETFPIMPDVFVEPIISGAYVRSTFEDLSAPGNTFSFQDGTSARGTIGARLTTEFRTGMMAIQPFLFGGFGIQNTDRNSTTVLSGDTTFTFFDSPFRNYGVASAGVNLFSDGPVSGFVKGDFLFASGAHSEAVWLGLKFTP